ncbi:hypothetical protein R5R35_007404 [Gryllus longicercus]|uniref:Uncharacterized protein n=1 Tax=Gryllus longicercus TaxID=2509291 RepID=A0AAN9Z5H0_9ORTH
MHLQVPCFEPRERRTVSDDGYVGRRLCLSFTKNILNRFGFEIYSADSVLQNEKTERLSQDERTDKRSLQKNRWSTTHSSTSAMLRTT